MSTFLCRVMPSQSLLERQKQAVSCSNPFSVSSSPMILSDISFERELLCALHRVLFKSEKCFFSSQERFFNQFQGTPKSVLFVFSNRYRFRKSTKLVSFFTETNSLQDPCNGKKIKPQQQGRIFNFLGGDTYGN